jgi:NAD(P)-dependent dehydrogenase (short-subunit alcohol dehydrogenase family)
MGESVSGKVVVVTGASSGIGRATVRELARRGALVALLARGRDGLEGSRADVEAAGSSAIAIPTDVADPDQVEAAARRAERELGPIDVWINVAMTTVFAFFDDIEPDEFRRATEVTYLGSVWGMRAALKRMAPRDRGTIVQVGSALGKRGIPLQSPYCGAKHGVQGVFESLRTELLHKGSNVHLTIVQLPGVNTPQFEHCRDKLEKRSQPVAPVYQPEVAADAVHYAAHHRRREVYVGLPTVYTIWGNKIAPAFVDRYLAKTAVSGQLSDAEKAPGRPDNLFDPLPGDPGAHGPYDDKAHRRSIQLWATKHRLGLLAGAGLAGAVAAGATLTAR